MALTATSVSGWHANLNHATTPDECRAISFPTLALRGENTQPAFHRFTEVVAGAIPGCTLATLPGAGHMSTLTHPEAVAAAVAGHLLETGDGDDLSGIPVKLLLFKQYQ